MRAQIVDRVVPAGNQVDADVASFDLGRKRSVFGDFAGGADIAPNVGPVSTIGAYDPARVIFRVQRRFPAPPEAS